MRTRASVTAAAVVVSTSVLVAQASLVLDQSSPSQPPPANISFAVGGLHHQVLSQTVTTGVSGRLRAVEVPIGCESGRLILEIRDVDGNGQPGGTAIFTESYDIADFPSPLTDAFVRIRLRGVSTWGVSASGVAMAVRLPHRQRAESTSNWPARRDWRCAW